MKVVEYRIDGSKPLYDFRTLQNILNIDRSKLQRNLKRFVGTDYVEYKNQYLYNEEILFQLMEDTLWDRLNKISHEINELPKD
jgi:hypothetical protein